MKVTRENLENLIKNCNEDMRDHGMPEQFYLVNNYASGRKTPSVVLSDSEDMRIIESRAAIVVGTLANCYEATKEIYFRNSYYWFMRKCQDLEAVNTELKSMNEQLQNTNHYLREVASITSTRGKGFSKK